MLLSMSFLIDLFVCLCVCQSSTGADEMSKPGAIMLPSYQISPASPRDKVNRKYAFKVSVNSNYTLYDCLLRHGLVLLYYDCNM